MSNADLMSGMIYDLRGMREKCEPKANTNPVYLHYSNAISNLKWLIEHEGDSRANE